MQTFLPYSDFQLSMSILDTKRLGKQRVEAMQIINTLENRKTGWSNHPAVRMWSNNIDALKYYHDCAVLEWVDRGYKNNMPLFDLLDQDLDYPSWLGNEQFHISHQSNLLRKNYSYYKKYFPDVVATLSYVWP